MLIGCGRETAGLEKGGVVVVMLMQIKLLKREVLWNVSQKKAFDREEKRAGRSWPGIVSVVVIFASSHSFKNITRNIIEHAAVCDK
jgi:hypothetical protein